MSDAMSFAQFDDHTAELLPARTVLSVMPARTINNPAPIGQVSNPSVPGHSSGFASTFMEMLGMTPSPVDPSSH
ncbi:MAG TPA: hypothetical protein VFO16_17955 [Pseudonocardiaceae bacterium]|nr:hypothetical protein [Pseudonocardiaceae bacterium]